MKQIVKISYLIIFMFCALFSRAQVKLAGASLTNVSTVPIVLTGYISSYDIIEVYFYGVTVTANGSQLLLQTSSNGTSYDSGSGNYAWAWENFDDGQQNASDVSMQITGDVGNATGNVLSGKLYIFSPNSTAYYPIFPASVGFVSNGGKPENTNSANVRLAQQQTKAIQFSLASGTFSTFTYKVIGYAN